MIHSKKIKKYPFNKEEKSIGDDLVSAWNKFVKLKSTHPDHTNEFKEGIHLCQNVLMHKMNQRVFPEYVPTYHKKNNKQYE